MRPFGTQQRLLHHTQTSGGSVAARRPLLTRAFPIRPREIPANVFQNWQAAFPERQRNSSLEGLLKNGISDGAGVLEGHKAQNRILQLLLFQSPNLSREELSAQILEAYSLHFSGSKNYARDLKRLSGAINSINRAYKDSLRKDGKTPAACHPLSIGRDIAACGGDATEIIAGLLHDTGEDFPEGKRKMFARFLGMNMEGHSLDFLVRKLTYDHIEKYEAYLNGLYAELGRQVGLFLTLLKGFDGLRNEQAIFPGMDPETFKRQVEKAMLHARVLKKLSKDIYSYMLLLLESKGVDISTFDRKSFAQCLAEQTGVRVVRDRDAASGEFIQHLPDAGSNVITIYEEHAIDRYKKSWQPWKITIEYSSEHVPKAVFERRMFKLFGERGRITETRSLLPPLLRDKDAYFYQVAMPMGFDEQADTAFFRHLHKLGAIWKKLHLPYFLFDSAHDSYNWAWRQVFYPR